LTNIDFLQEGIEKLQKLPEVQRQKLIDRFNDYFGFKPAEKERILRTFSDPERQQIEKTLNKFEQLSSVQRAQCIHSFEKFAGLSLEERQQFLKNAALWKLMTPSQRQEWKQLVDEFSSIPFPPLDSDSTAHPAAPGKREP